MLDPSKITVNGVVYVPQLVAMEFLDDMPYVIVRTYSAGVFAGYLKHRDAKEVELVHARRLWYWSGAASLSQLAIDGTSNPGDCKFPCEVASVTLTEAIEILTVTAKARTSIQQVTIWSQ